MKKFFVLISLVAFATGCAPRGRGRGAEDQSQQIPARGQQAKSRPQPQKSAKLTPPDPNAPAPAKPVKNPRGKKQAAGQDPQNNSKNDFADSKAAGGRTQAAVVAVDGAAVFEAPNFDSPIKAYFEKGKKVRISEATSAGIGGFGLFYKLIGKGQVLGYMTDVDLVPQFKTDEFGDVEENQKTGKNTDLVENPVFKGEEPVVDPNAPMVFQRFIGGSLYNVNFAEKMGGRTLSSNTWMYGFKLSGANTLFEGPPLDINVKLGPGAPTYYKRFAASTTGFFFIIDALLTLPLMEFDRGMIFYGFGPQFVYTKFSVAPILNISSALDSQEVRMGIGFMAGFKYRVYKRWFLHGDVKYYKEVTSYPAFGLAIQKTY